MGGSKFTTGTQGGLYNKNLGRVRFELVGDWAGKLQQLERLPRRVSQLVLRSQVEFAKMYVDAIKDKILTNGAGLGWPPYSVRYGKWKAKKSPNKGFYQLTGAYMSSIDYYIRTAKPVSTVVVGIMGNAQSAHSDLSVKQYALILERGSLTRNIAARPLWGPTFREIGGLKAMALPLQLSLNKIKIS